MIKRSLLAGALILTAAVPPLAVAQSAAAQAESRQAVRIVNAAVDSCLDDHPAGRATLRDCDDSAGQSWIMMDTGRAIGGTTRIRNGAHRECLRAPLPVGGMCMLNNDAALSGLWVVEDVGGGRVFLKNVHAGMENCLAADGSGALVLRECDPDNANTQWYLEW